MKKIKFNTLSLITLLVILTTSITSCESNTKEVNDDYKTYQVEITYCDNRKKDTVDVKHYLVPDNSCISNYKRAVPDFTLYEFFAYYNVCNVKTLKQY